MTPDHLCTSICETLSDLFECSPAPRRSVRVRTPLTYPDGGIVDVFVLEDDGQRRVTDFGETLGWLRMQSVDGRRTPKQKELIEDTCQTLGVEVFRGQLVLRLHADDEIGEAVLRLAQAAVRVSDLWFTLRARPTKTTAKEVNRWLIQKEIEFNPSVQRSGKSGRSWTIDYEIYTTNQTSLIVLLSPGSRGATQRMTEHALAGWVDLDHLKSNTSQQSFISLFDDTKNVWQEKDFGLLASVSKIARWSRRDEFEQMLLAA